MLSRKTSVTDKTVSITISKENNNKLTPNDNSDSFDLSYYRLYENKFTDSIKIIDLVNITKEIFFYTKEMTLSYTCLNRILIKYASSVSTTQILNWIQTAFFTLGKSKENKENLKNAYYTYRKYNIKLFIMESMNQISFTNLKEIPDLTVVNKNSKIFDPLFILFFLIIYSNNDLKQKAEILFGILDYKQKELLNTGSKSFNLILRKFIIVHLFMADSCLNNFISEIPNLSNKSLNTTTSSDDLIIYNKLNAYSLLYKKSLLYLKETSGVMKDFINYISQNLIFHERLTNQKINKTKFIQLLENKQFGLLSPQTLRTYLIQYMKSNSDRTNVFLDSLKKIIPKYEKKFLGIAQKEESLEYHVLNVEEMDMVKDYKKYKEIFKKKENFDFFKKKESFLYLKRDSELYEKDLSRKKTIKRKSTLNNQFQTELVSNEDKIALKKRIEKNKLLISLMKDKTTPDSSLLKNESCENSINEIGNNEEDDKFESNFSPYKKSFSPTVLSAIINKASSISNLVLSTKQYGMPLISIEENFHEENKDEYEDESEDANEIISFRNKGVKSPREINSNSNKKTFFKKNTFNVKHTELKTKLKEINDEEEEIVDTSSLNKLKVISKAAKSSLNVKNGNRQMNEKMNLDENSLNNSSINDSIEDYIQNGNLLKEQWRKNKIMNIEVNKSSNSNNAESIQNEIMRTNDIMNIEVNKSKNSIIESIIQNEIMRTNDIMNIEVNKSLKSNNFESIIQKENLNKEEIYLDKIEQTNSEINKSYLIKNSEVNKSENQIKEKDDNLIRERDNKFSEIDWEENSGIPIQEHRIEIQNSSHLSNEFNNNDFMDNNNDTFDLDNTIKNPESSKNIEKNIKSSELSFERDEHKKNIYKEEVNSSNNELLLSSIKLNIFNLNVNVNDKFKNSDEYSRIENNENYNWDDSITGIFDLPRVNFSEPNIYFNLDSHSVSIVREEEKDKDKDKEKDKEMFNEKKKFGFKKFNKNKLKEVINEDLDENRPSNINDYNNLLKLEKVKVLVPFEIAKKEIIEEFEENHISSEYINEEEHVSLDLISVFYQYFLQFSQIKTNNIEKLKLNLFQLNEKEINKKSSSNKELHLCDKELVYNILENKISIEIINLYFGILNQYNKFLLQKNILNTSVRFVDIEFFKILQEIYIIDKNYSKLIENYKDILFNDNVFFSELKNQTEKHILIVPIYLENPVEPENKNLFLAKFIFKEKLIVMYDACEILIKDQMISK